MRRLTTLVAPFGYTPGGGAPGVEEVRAAEKKLAKALPKKFKKGQKRKGGETVNEARPHFIISIHHDPVTYHLLIKVRSFYE
jgi:hypothetical protein